MAIKGTIKLITDTSIKDDTGGSGGTATATASSGTATASGSIKDDTGGSGGTVTLTITEEHTGREVTAVQPYYKELCLNVGDTVRFEEIEAKDSTGKRTTFATGVSRVTVGTVNFINADGNTGIIFEKDNNKKIPFFQTNLAKLKIKTGDFVRYDLVLSLRGVETAVNLREID